MVRRTTFFMSCNSQAMRLPKDFQLADREVHIFRRGEEIVIRPISKPLAKGYGCCPRAPRIVSQNRPKVSPPQDRDWG